MEKKKNKIKLLAILAALSYVTMVTGMAAYSSGTDSKTNSFTFGSVRAELDEPGWESSLDMVQGLCMTKDPVVTNTGDNAAYVFAEVKIPKRDIYTYDPESLARNERSVTELVQTNRGTADVYGSASDHNMTARHTPGKGWILIGSDKSGDGYNTYVYAYASDGKCTELAKDASTTPVFDTVTFCYAVEGQGLDEGSFKTDVTAYAIQAGSITGTDTKDPETVWGVLKNQMGQ